MTPPTAPAPDLELLKVKPTDIGEHPNNPRQNINGDDLVDSIKSFGILEPLLVAPAFEGVKPAKATWVLVAGHRRLAAARKARMGTVPVVVREDLDTPDKQLEAMLVENLHREDLTPVEEGHGYQALLDLGLTQTAVADRIGMPRKRISERLKVYRLPVTIQKAAHEGHSTLEQALAVARFKDEAAIAALEKAAGTADFAHELAKQEGRAERVREWAALKKEISEADGWEIVINGSERAEDVEAHGARLNSIRALPSFVNTWQPARDQWGQAKNAHPACAKGVLLLMEHGSDPSQNVMEWWCSQPDNHADVDDDATKDEPETDEERAARAEEDKERAAAERARQKLQDEFDAAAKVRREHVAKFLHAKDIDEKLVKDLVIDQLLSTCPIRSEYAPIGDALRTASRNWPVLAAILRIDVDAAVDERHGLVSAKLARLTLPALVLLQNVAWDCDIDLTSDGYFLDRVPEYVQNLVDDRAANSGDLSEYPEPNAVWVEQLTTILGHTWSSFEKDRFGLKPDGTLPDPTPVDYLDEDADAETEA